MSEFKYPTITPPAPNFFDRLRLATNELWQKWQELDRNKKLVSLGMGVVVFFLLGVGFLKLRTAGWSDFQLTNRAQPGVNLATPEPPRDKELPLTGNLVTQKEYDEITSRKILGVVVENHTEARPQSSLSTAELIYEFLAEGGITRFVALYHQNQPEVVGPVRSIRSYMLDWLSEYGDPIFMHIGGATSSNPAANALFYIQQHGMKSIGVSGSNTFWRITERFAPHNAYSNTLHLWEEAQRIGWTKLESFGFWKFKDEASPEKRGAEFEIKVNWDGWGKTPYSVIWHYDPQTNRYLRFYDEAADLDVANNNTQLTAKNLIIQFSLQTLANDGTARILYQTTGEDRALIFRDGQIIEGRWKKSNRLDRTKFYDSEGNEIEFNRGVSWIMVIPTNSEVSY